MYVYFPKNLLLLICSPLQVNNTYPLFFTFCEEIEVCGAKFFLILCPSYKYIYIYMKEFSGFKKKKMVEILIE